MCLSRGVTVDEYVSAIGKTLKVCKAVTQTRIAALVQSILRLRADGEKLTQVRLVQISGLSVKMVRRLFLAALAAAELVRDTGAATARPKAARVPSSPQFGLAAPLLESRVGLPPPVGVSA